ncbi:MAG: ZrgA family zinc uptake protein, partial [Longimicrobiales bacterium]
RGSSDGAPGGVGSSGGSLGTAGAHEHGVARVNVAVEGNGATIEFFAPGQSVYGFEGEPRDAQQATARAAGIERLKQEVPRMFAFDPSLDCRFGSPHVELEDDDHAEGEHHDEAATRGGEQEAAPLAEESHEAHESEHTGEEYPHDEIHAEVEVQCARSPAGTDLRLAVTESFPEIVQIDLQVLSEAQQSGARVAASGHSVQL